MVWRTLLIDAWVDAARLRAAVADVIGVAEADLAVVDDEVGILAVPESARVLLERTRQYRAFPSQILAILRDPDLARRYEHGDTARGAVLDLAGRLGQTILVDHGPIEPWELLRVRPDGVEDIVAVEWETTGDVDSAVIVRERSLAAPHEDAVARVTA